MSQEKGSRSRVSFARGVAVELVSVGLIYVLAQITVGLIIAVFGGASSESLTNNTTLVLVAYVIGGAATVGLTLGLMRHRKIGISLLRMKRLHILDFVYAIVGFVVYMMITILVSASIRVFIPEVNLDQEQDLGLNSVSGALLLLTFLALVVVAPIAEELLFRGFLYGRLNSRRLKPIISAIITSLLFGLVHGQINVGIDTFLLSMVMIYLLEKRQSLWVTILLHAIKNGVAFLALFVFKIV
jgi:membrane protease YdiL (CAAX protease family)